MIARLIDTQLTFVVVERNHSEALHLFCGEQNSVGAECPNCKAPLMRYLSLDLADDKLIDIQCGLRRIELLFCWPCGLSQEDFVYRILSNESIEIFRAGFGAKNESFPYENYPRSFPEIPVKIVLEDQNVVALASSYLQASDDEIDNWDIRDKLDVERPRNQIGGIPILYDDSPRYCPSCNEEMPFLARFADKNADQRGFVDNDYVQAVFYFCKKCLVVCARQECD